MNCERINDITEVYLIPIGELTPAVPFQVAAATIDDAGLPGLDSAVAASVCFSLPASPVYGKPAFSIELDTSPQIKVVSSHSRGGIRHVCTVEVQAADYSEQIEKHVRTLMRDPHHLLLVRGDGTRLFVQCTQDGYRCESEDSAELRSMQFTVTNVNGYQQIV